MDHCKYLERWVAEVRLTLTVLTIWIIAMSPLVYCLCLLHSLDTGKSATLSFQESFIFIWKHLLLNHPIALESLSSSIIIVFTFVVLMFDNIYNTVVLVLVCSTLRLMVGNWFGPVASLIVTRTIFRVMFLASISSLLVKIMSVTS